MAYWGELIKHMNFDKKMRLFISMVIVLTALIIMIFSTISATTSLKNKSENLVRIQVNTVSENLQANLENFNYMAQSLMLDNQVQRYLNYGSGVGENGGSLVNDVRDSMNIMLNMQNSLNFITITRTEATNYIYKGVRSLAGSRYLSVMETDYENSKESGYGSMRISVNNLYFNDGSYTVTIYQPIYDKNAIGVVIGTLTMNLDAEGLLNTVQDQQEGTMAVEMSLIGLDGTMVYCSDQNLIGNPVDYAVQMDNQRGSFIQNRSLYVYERLGSWDYYVVGAIPMEKLTEDGIRTVIFLVVIVLLIVAISLFLTSKMISKVYAPMDKLVRKMESVSEGRLDVRVSEDKMGDDFFKISRGFNLMMDQIATLVEQVKIEQRQVEQIRFNALQSQIQPHFLYNTLECIHWQAVMDGNKVVSKLVKALATYYRLCLSKGRDVISLSQEIAHIESYLTIQNMRYDDIIEGDVEIDPYFNDVQIPKMTLQPLIENAIYHGIKIKEGRKGKVTIRAREDDRDVLIEVADSGSGMAQEDIDVMNKSISIHDESFGYGVRNVNKRIEILFGRDYGLFYMKNLEGGITVRIRLPKNIEAMGEDISCTKQS